MIPKIIITKEKEKDKVLESLGFTEKNTLYYEGADADIANLRHFMNEGISISKSKRCMPIVIGNADKLSPECQSILLKPLEESDENVSIVLIAELEANMLPTILSRCVIEFIQSDNDKDDLYWPKIMEIWDKGPSAAIAFSDKLTREEAIEAIEETIIKLKSSLNGKINKKRLTALEWALDCLFDLKYTNINQKLAVDNFLLRSWRAIKA